MKQKNEVSIIIPCYNSERFIDRTIRSVLNQSISEFEIIVVNDGSTDSSREIIEKINDPRIRLINTNNNGVSKARNTGLQEARGKLVLFLDSDDLLPKNYLETSIEVLSGEECDFCTFKIVHINENDELIKSTFNLRGTYENIQFEIASFSENVSACPSTYVYKRKSLTSHDLSFNEKLQSPEDRYFLLEAGRYLKGYLIGSCSLMYRVTGSSLSNDKNIRLVKMQETYLKEVVENKVIQSKKTETLFIRKISYQLFVDYFRFNKFFKSLFYLGKYTFNYIR